MIGPRKDLRRSISSFQAACVSMFLRADEVTSQLFAYSCVSTRYKNSEAATRLSRVTSSPGALLIAGTMIQSRLATNRNRCMRTCHGMASFLIMMSSCCDQEECFSFILIRDWSGGNPAIRKWCGRHLSEQFALAPGRLLALSPLDDFAGREPELTGQFDVVL